MENQQPQIKYLLGCITKTIEIIPFNCRTLYIYTEKWEKIHNHHPSVKSPPVTSTCKKPSGAIPEQCLEVFREFRSSCVSGVHGDKHADGGHEIDVVTQQTTRALLRLDRV